MLLQELKNDDESNRLYAARVLWRIDGQREIAWAVFRAALNDKKTTRLAALILGDIGPDAKVAVPTLRELLKKDRSTRQSAQKALWKIIPPD